VYIVADENIPLVKDVFSSMGTVHLLPGRRISHADIVDADILLVRSVTRVDRALLEGTKVSFVATATIGTDHIDLPYLHKQNIDFAHAPGSNAESVAQYITAALIYLTRHFAWNSQRLTVGVIGVGNIGSKVYRNIQTLGMRPLLCDPPLMRSTGDSVFRPLQEVLDEADVLTFHVPLITEGDDRTYHLVDEQFLSRVKKGVVIINTSRGKVLDEKTVLHHAGTIGGMVLDVWENEPTISTALLERTVLSTPHIAGYSFDGKINGTEAIYRAACKAFQIAPEWSSRSVLNDEVTTIASVLPGLEPLASAILQAYPIEDDSRQLRRILNMSSGERGSYFDQLRKNYPKRLEFRHFSAAGMDFDEDTLRKLELLGFMRHLHSGERPL